MRISISEFEKNQDNTIKLVLNGTEEWLKEIYDRFPKQDFKDLESNLLQAHLVLKWQEDLDMVFVSGKITFTPLVSCSLCTQPIPWPIEENINTTFVKYVQTSDGEEEASNIDESYLIEPDKTIDLFPLINDAIELSLPSRFFLSSDENENECLVCHKFFENDIPLASTSSHETDWENNPFSILSKLQKH